MRNKLKLKCILIFTFSILFIGCAFQKNMKDDPSLKNQLNNKKSEESVNDAEIESDEKTSEKLDKDSKESGEKTSEEDKGKISKESEENKETASNLKKIIYLTFDDGPSYKVTNNVLNILKENKVNATFFLIGNQVKDRGKVVKRIYNEGNSIGLHSHTHNYKIIYNNEELFIKEMIDCRDEIKKVVGISPNIIRFPGGSYKHLSESFLGKLHENNFKVYDWNMENRDGLKPKTSPEELYEKAIEGSENKKRIILLLHCTDSHENTCKALPEIIEYYKSHGYEFRTITEETKELYSPIKS